MTTAAELSIRLDISILAPITRVWGFLASEEGKGHVTAFEPPHQLAFTWRQTASGS